MLFPNQWNGGIIYKLFQKHVTYYNYHTALWIVLFPIKGKQIKLKAPSRLFSIYYWFAVLKRMTKTKDKDLRGACSSALFQIQGDVDTTPSPSVSEAAPPSYQEAMSEPKSSSASTSAQVMVSYQWDSQTRAIMIRDKLLQAGYKVWMDLTNMRKFLHSKIRFSFPAVLCGYGKMKVTL